jgi:signal transduction histidine kinase
MEELKRLTPLDLKPDYSPETFAEMTQQLRSGEKELVPFVTRHRRKDGSLYDVEVHLQRATYQGQPVFLAIILDIGDRIKLENALSQRALEAELLYEAVAMADEVDSLDAALEKCLDIVCEMTDWPVGHVYVPSVNGTQQLEPTKIWHLAYEQRFTKFREVTEQTTFAMGEGLPGRIWKTGEPAWIVDLQDDDNCSRNRLCGDLGVKGAFGFPLQLKGETVAILEFFHEGALERNETLLLLVRSVGEQVGRVMERKEAEQQMRRQQELVEQELEKAKEELVLRTRLAAVGQMSAQVAHELRNPLGAVSNAVYYLQRHVPASEEKWSEYLHLIDNEVTTCNRFIGELLDVTRAKAPIRETTNLAHLVERVLTRHDVPQRVDIQLVCDPDPFEIFADNDQIVQVLDNLLQNALDASGQKAARIKIRAYRDAESDIITVQDAGSGIPPEHRASVFDVLFTTKSSGTGLGLPICKQIIEKHGGTIELLDELSPGTTFQIRLPRALVFS